MAHRTMWKASAVSARECARKPQISSSRKKAVSIAIMTLMRVLLDHTSREEEFAIATRVEAPKLARRVRKLQKETALDLGWRGESKQRERRWLSRGDEKGRQIYTIASGIFPPSGSDVCVVWKRIKCAFANRVGSRNAVGRRWGRQRQTTVIQWQTLEAQARRSPSVALGLQDAALQSTKQVDNSSINQCAGCCELALRGVFRLL